MNHFLQRPLATIALGFGLMAGPALADSISPSTYSATIGVGGSTTVHKTVTVTAGTPTSSAADIVFLSDTTGSMGGIITSVRNNASTILTNTAGFGNVQWGVAEYKDTSDGAAANFKVNQTVTANTSLVQTGINAWAAAGGGDTPENALNALTQIATTPVIGFRAGSQKFVVWFGDAPAHDGEPGYPATTASTLTALQAAGITVIAVSASSGGGLDATGQATTITAGTGGSLQNITSNPGSSIATTIVNALTTAFSTYTSVSLDTSAVPAGLSVTVLPASYTGAFDRSITRTFEFDVTFGGLVAGDYSFNVGALVNGGTVATEADHIVVGAPGETPIPGAGVLMLSGVAGMAALVRRRRKQKAA
jgi:hypothetical protein